MAPAVSDTPVAADAPASDPLPPVAADAPASDPLPPVATDARPSAEVALPIQPATDWRAALRAALYAFLVSRLIIFSAGALAVAHSQQWPADNAGEPELRLSAQVFATLGERALGNDAGWYLGIARGGYAVRPFDTSRQENWAFFPLHPLLWRATMAVGLDPLASGLLLANGLFLFGLFQGHRWAQRVGGRDVADRMVLCIALFPAAYFFALPWTEALFLALVASCLLAIEERRWGTAAAIAGLASGTRLVGIGLAGVLWLRSAAEPSLPHWKRVVHAAVALSGLIAFMAFLLHASGNPVAFADIQVAWGRERGLWFQPFERWWADPAMVASWWTTHPLAIGSLLFGLAASVSLWRRGLRAIALFTLMCVVLPWSSGSMSMPRYLTGCLPAMLALAFWLQRPAALLAWLLIGSGLLAWMSAAFFVGAWYAGA